MLKLKKYSGNKKAPGPTMLFRRKRISCQNGWSVSRIVTVRKMVQCCENTNIVNVTTCNMNVLKTDFLVEFD